MESDNQLADRIRRTLGKARIPGCSVAVVDPQGVRWSSAFGYADLERKRPATASTVFHLFSGTKLFTATAILELAESGRLDLDGSLSAYLPDLPEVRRITVRNLLSHSSGLEDTLRGFLAVYFPGEHAPTTSEALSGYRLRAGGVPGRKGEYRNVNYALLGEIVSRVSGLPYREYVRRHVLAPLSSDADFEIGQFDSSRLATGYLSRWDPSRIMLRFLFPSLAGRIYNGPAANGLVPLADYDLSTASIGGLIGTVHSFTPFLVSQLNGGQPLLSREATRQMQALVVAGRAGIESRVGVGLGWKLGTSGHGRFLNHEGSGAGFTSELRLYPDRELGIVLLTNKSSMSKTMRVAHEICELIAERYPSLQDGENT